ncbi:hypothetical protein E2C01_066557 [Portunus trituberculatus]|uniref:Reverse transcriptase/retrotransposon-derived protein RNase H-like domain-containing protein n=1 Tax=Portunus trituberculatus TaxID=210409 RepID=A0A5B7HR78_PORTR|nr:hypothetical protein [Portunus trituberculatus]
MWTRLESLDCSWLINEVAESTLQEKLIHQDRAAQLTSLLFAYPSVFASAPGRTYWAEHDVDVGEAEPVKLSPYRVSPLHVDLLQKNDQGVAHSICYYSKKLSPAQRNYSVIEKKLLALILALKHFEVYVPAFGSTVTIHRPPSIEIPQ